jgi:superfamily I DNA/RNA helicase
VATHEICVTPYKPAIREALAAAGILTYELKDREEDPGEREPGVRIGSMKRIKGLEFRAVAMACAVRHDPLHDLKHANALSRCERYVAATRAREYLLVTLPDA